MKKLLLSVLNLLAILQLNAQISNWDSVAVAGIINTDTTVDFTVLQKFNNKLYVGGYSNKDGTLKLFSSASGSLGSYTLETNFSTLILPTGTGASLSASTANSNYMFLGTGVTPGQATVAVPQVYRFFGSYSAIGPNASDYALINTGGDNDLNVGKGNPKIDALAQYSPTGSNDTVYAFVNPNDGSHAISVWKAAVNTTSPSWKNSTNFSMSSGITKVYDAIVWHNRLYIAVAHTDSTDAGSNNYKVSLVLSTANGVTWDTVATTNSLLNSISSTIYSSTNYAFAALEIHNDTLVAALDNSNGPVLWYTTDKTASPAWHNMCNYGAGADSPVNGITDIQSDGYNIWMQTDNGYTASVYQYNAYLAASAASYGGMVDITLNTGVEVPYGSVYGYRLQYFNTAIYTAGYIQYGSQPQPPYGDGNIWRLFIPKAGFKDSLSAGTGFCQNNTLFLKSTATNSNTYQWYLNGNLYSSSKDTIYILSNAGTYTFTQQVYNGTVGSIGDDITKVITVNQSPTVGTLSGLSNICMGQTDSISTQVLSNIPYTCTWVFTSPNTTLTHTTSTAYIMITPPVPGTYTTAVTVKDTNNCVAVCSATLSVNVHQNNSLSGFITDKTGNTITSGKVFLFEKKTTNVGVADSTANTSIGSYAVNSVNYNYTFPQLSIGNYYIKVIADPIAYPLSIGTYYSNKPNAFQWDSAIFIPHNTCTAGNDTANIKIIEIQKVTGPGSISGDIDLLSSFGHRLSNTNQVMGAPLKGIDVKLGKNPGGGCVARTTATTTMTTGSNTVYTYQFDSIPAGNYKIYVDIPNYGMDSARVASISKQDTASINNNYYVDSTKIHVDTAKVTTGIFKQSSICNTLKVYPNPASDIAYLDFENSTEQNVNLQLYDIAGKQISTLYDKKMPQGNQTLTVNLAELQLNKGVYFIRATLNGQAQTLKLTIISN